MAGACYDQFPVSEDDAGHGGAEACPRMRDQSSGCPWGKSLIRGGVMSFWASQRKADGIVFHQG